MKPPRPPDSQNEARSAPIGKDTFALDRCLFFAASWYETRNENSTAGPWAVGFTGTVIFLLPPAGRTAKRFRRQAVGAATPTATLSAAPRPLLVILIVRFRHRPAISSSAFRSSIPTFGAAEGPVVVADLLSVGLSELLVANLSDMRGRASELPETVCLLSPTGLYEDASLGGLNLCPARLPLNE